MDARLVHAQEIAGSSPASATTGYQPRILPNLFPLCRLAQAHRPRASPVTPYHDALYAAMAQWQSLQPMWNLPDWNTPVRFRIAAPCLQLYSPSHQMVVSHNNQKRNMTPPASQKMCIRWPLTRSRSSGFPYGWALNINVTVVTISK